MASFLRTTNSSVPPGAKSPSTHKFSTSNPTRPCQIIFPEHRSRHSLQGSESLRVQNHRVVPDWLTCAPPYTGTPSLVLGDPSNLPMTWCFRETELQLFSRTPRLLALSHGSVVLDFGVPWAKFQKHIWALTSVAKFFFCKTRHLKKTSTPIVYGLHLIKKQNQRQNEQG